MKTLAPLVAAALLVAVPAFAQDEPDEEKATQLREENRLLKKARRLAEDGDKDEAWKLFLQLQSLAHAHENPKMEVTALEEARAVAPSEQDEARICGAIGHIHMTQNEHVKSVKAFRRACKLSPDDASKWNSLGYSLHLAGNEQESVDAFEQCIELDRNNKEARYSLGVSARLLGKPDKALKVHEWLVEHKNELTASWYFAFESETKKKKAKGLDMSSHESRKAIVELEVAIDRVFLEEFDEAEKIVAKLKDKIAESDLEPALDVAIDETARALEMRPSHLQLHWLLGVLYEAHGEPETAKAHFEKFVELEKKVHPLARKAKEKLAAGK
ncbi:MAG: tetratricopeptide repeat protein [Planctomycetota bacterium]